MATIKSYTDISQSKKLAEILPLGSADMVYVKKRYGTSFYNVPLFHYEIKVQNPKYTNMDFCIPAWSLAALLGVLPSATLDSSNDHYYRLRCMEKYTEWYDNAIDACYEMIIRLNELNLL